MKYTLLIGRILFAPIFLMTVMSHFSSQTIQYASSIGLPMANVLVPLSGLMAFIGALSIVLGYKAKAGAWLIVLFLVPTTFLMHNFWAMTDPMMSQMHMAMFMKNISMIGAALMIAHWGSGPMSLDHHSRIKHAEN